MNTLPLFEVIQTPKPKLLDRVRTHLRTKHYSYKTEETYINWIKRFIFFHHKQHPQYLGAKDIEAFLNHLATKLNVSASTQNQALNALVFLYRYILHQDFQLGEITRAKRPKRLPVVLTREESKRLLSSVDGTKRLMLELLYGTGMRLMELLRLRVKDIDFSRNLIVIREGKEMKDRVTMLPQKLKEELLRHLGRVKLLHEADLKNGEGKVFLPFALEKKYPNANKEWGWQYVFPSKTLSEDPRSGIVRRHHVHENALQKITKQAARIANIPKPVHVQKYSLVDQMRRSSRSVAANLSEAWRKRRYGAAFVSKLSDAESEACETQTWIEVSQRCGYLSSNDACDLEERYERILGQIVRMIQNPKKWALPPFPTLPISQS